LASPAALVESPSLPLDPDLVERLAIGRAEPEWLVGSRLAAAREYAEVAWPTGAEEEWRRFPLRGLPTSWEAIDAAGTVERGTAPAGVLFDDLLSAAAARPEIVRPALERPERVASHRAPSALGRALWSGGTFLHVPAGIDAGTLSARVHWPAGVGPLISRTVVVAEPRSSVTFLEELASDDGPARLAIPLLDVHVGAGARVRYIRIQRLGDGVWDLSSQLYVSDRDSELASFNVVVGASKSKVGVTSDIRGDGATVKLYGLVAGGDSQRIDVNTFQRLDGKGSTSDLLFLSALYEAAKVVNYGVIRVEPTSSGTGSYQECRNLLLSDKAGADPIPVLEILTNDVARCGHGATAGAIEDTELFYVMTRGLSHDDAERLLVRGFFQRVIDVIPDRTVRGRILDALAPRIGRLAELDAEAA